jgi:hypothetical protein
LMSDVLCMGPASNTAKGLSARDFAKYPSGGPGEGAKKWRAAYP